MATPARAQARHVQVIRVPAARAQAVRGLVLAVALAVPIGCGAGTNPPATVPGSSQQQPASAGPRPTSDKPLVPAGRALVIFGSDTVVAEVARTDAERERGLMYRNEVPAGTGMLFVFPDAQERSFWMENTYVPLDVAFFDPSLAIVDIQQMEPETTAYHDSKAPAMYALEVPKGWFAAHRIGIGARAKLVVGSD